jgi:hypothetical protein
MVVIFSQSIDASTEDIMDEFVRINIPTQERGNEMNLKLN